MPRLYNTLSRSTLGNCSIYPRVTDILSTRAFASKPPTQSSTLRVGPAKTPRDLCAKSTNPAAMHAEKFATETRGPPQPPQKEYINLVQGHEPPTFLGTTKRLPEFNLADKVVLVSGGARGLGLVQAEALLEAGATVYCLDRLTDPSPYFQVVQQRAQETLGTELHYRQIDVRDSINLNRIIMDIADKHQRLDGLLAAAGIQQETPALEYTAEDSNNMFAVNCTGVFMTAQATAKAMIKYECAGSIAMIASMSGTVANRGLICPAYNASKAGVIQLARNLASEWGKHKIRVNTISPGYIVTDMVERLFGEWN